MFGFSQVKYCIFKLCSLFCGILSWFSGTTLANNRAWRVAFASQVIRFVFIGLWEAYYYQKIYVAGSIVEKLGYGSVNTSWIITTDCEHGRRLMLWANCMKSLALAFGTRAILVSCIKVPYPESLRLCHNVAATFLLLTTACMAGAMSWNYAVHVYNQGALEFPIRLPLERDALKMKHSANVFLVAVTRVSMSLLGTALFLIEIRSLKHQYQMKINQAKAAAAAAAAAKQAKTAPAPNQGKAAPAANQGKAAPAATPAPCQQ